MKFSRYQIRFLIPLGITLILASILAFCAMGVLTQRWFLKDMELRSSLVASTLSDTIAEAVEENNLEHLRMVFEKAAADERLSALGLCGANGNLLLATQEYPTDLTCAQAKATRKHSPPILDTPSGDLHIAIYPVHLASGENIKLILLHGMDYVERRTTLSRQYFLIFVTLLGIVIAITTITTAQLSWNTWVRGVRGILRGDSIISLLPGRPTDLPVELASDIRTRLRDLEDEYRRLHYTEESWTPERLQTLLRSQLKGDQVMIISNREPWIHDHINGEIVAHQPASGLVTAIEPVMRACSGVWIAHGSGSADHVTADAQDRLVLPPGSPQYTLRRIWLSKEEEDGYYSGMSNKGLWPLSHHAHVQPSFSEQDWNYYQSINQRFADAAIAEARVEDPVILVQDYHLALVPAMLREKLPKAFIITFWHIPWPNHESFTICPWHSKILKGLLGSTILGFQTRYHCHNFIETADRLLEARIDHERSTVLFGSQETLVESYPISIAWPDNAQQAAWPSVQAHRHATEQRFRLPEDSMILLGVDRLDYTKGLYERLSAYEHLLEAHPEYIGRLVFLQIAVPSREHIDEYRRFGERIADLTERINARFGTKSYRPIHLLAKFHSHEELLALYRSADGCVVSSLHDGMNLVCKEFIAARDDEQGVLLLSQFAGATRELPEALPLNPYHIEGMAEAMHRALTMSSAEQRERMASMRMTVREANVFRWAGRMLTDASRQRLNQRMEQRVSAFHEKLS
jgi:trehalose-6-phosphate synthase